MAKEGAKSVYTKTEVLALIAAHAADADIHHEVMPTSHKARAHPSAAQAISSQVATKLTLDVEDYDPGSHFASNKYTVAKAGVYLIVGQVTIAAELEGGYCGAMIYKNGASLESGLQFAYSTIYPYAWVIELAELAVDDYIELYGYNGADDPFNTDPDYCFLSVHLISA